MILRKIAKPIIGFVFALLVLKERGLRSLKYPLTIELFQCKSSFRFAAESEKAALVGMPI